MQKRESNQFVNENKNQHGNAEKENTIEQKSKEKQKKLTKPKQQKCEKKIFSMRGDASSGKCQRVATIATGLEHQVFLKVNTKYCNN